MRWNKGASHRRTRLPAAATVLILSLVLARLALGQNPPAVPPPADQPPASASPAAAQHTLLILIDPAHGGGEPGATLNAAMPEKDVTLTIARRLRQELAVRGIQALLIRDGDSTLSADQRAQIVNSVRPALYIAIHATSQGRGMRIYTAMLPAGGDNAGPFVDWQTAQSSAITRSRWVQDQIAAAIQKIGFPLDSLVAPLRPLNNVVVPALAIEIAPTTGGVSQLASIDYQQMITAALANAITAIRMNLESSR